MLADFIDGKDHPQIHTVREIVVQKDEGNFVFPLKYQYEKARLSMPALSDEDAASVLDEAGARVEEAFNALEAVLEDSAFDVPPTAKSDTNSDASTTEMLPQEAPGPTISPGGNTEADDTPKPNPSTS
jgi:hypothetical protein